MSDPITHLLKWEPPFLRDWDQKSHFGSNNGATRSLVQADASVTPAVPTPACAEVEVVFRELLGDGSSGKV